MERKDLVERKGAAERPSTLTLDSSLLQEDRYSAILG